MEQTVRIYRGKKKIADAVRPSDIGFTIADDLHRHFIYNLCTNKYGKDIVKSMQEEKMKEWELYPEDVGLPIYRIVLQK